MATALRDRLFPPAAPVEFDATAKIVAGSFTILTALLTFFQIKDGVLDSLLRTQARPAIYVFCLIGLAAVCGVCAPIAAKAARGVRASLLVAVSGALAFFAYRFFPDSTAPDHHKLAVVLALLVAVALVVAAVLFWSTIIPAGSAILVFGIVGMTLGLYGAAKIAVLSKSGPLNPQVGTSLSLVGGVPQLTADVTAGRLDDAFVRLVVVTAGSESDNDPVARRDLYPNAEGAVEESVVVAVPALQEQGLEVWADVCQLKKPKNDDDVTCTLDPADRRSLLRQSSVPGIAGTITVTPTGAVTASLSGFAESGARVRVQVMSSPSSGAPVSLLTATALADLDGSLSWTATFSVPVSADSSVSLGVQSCVQSSCTGEMDDVAVFHVLANAAVGQGSPRLEFIVHLFDTGHMVGV